MHEKRINEFCSAHVQRLRFTVIRIILIMECHTGIIHRIGIIIQPVPFFPQLGIRAFFTALVARPFVLALNEHFKDGVLNPNFTIIPLYSFEYCLISIFLVFHYNTKVRPHLMIRLVCIDSHLQKLNLDWLKHPEKGKTALVFLEKRFIERTKKQYSMFDRQIQTVLGILNQ